MQTGFANQKIVIIDFCKDVQWSFQGLLIFAKKEKLLE